MRPKRTFQDLMQQPDLRGKSILMRVDLNLPRDGSADGSSDVGAHKRFTNGLPTMRELAQAGARIGLLSHYARPKGKRVESLSLRPLVGILSEALEQDITFAPDCIGAPAQTAMAGLPEGGICLLENTRFHAGEEANAPDFIAALARLGDAFLMDAFSVAHREHASSCGLVGALPSYAGPSLAAEWKALDRLLTKPAAPFCAIVGGAKISGKLPLLQHLVETCDALILGGGMANSFLAAQGIEVGRSLFEPDLQDQARAILDAAKKNNCEVLLPTDAVVAPSLQEPDKARTLPLSAMQPDNMILDCGPQTCEQMLRLIDKAASVIWNGPLGAFETPPFDAASLALARHLAARVQSAQLVAVAGGGDSLALLQRAGCEDDLSYVSTAGGAFLAWLKGSTLPVLRALAA